jgi:hypothetical protein
MFVAANDVEVDIKMADIANRSFKPFMVGLAGRNVK